MTTITCTHPITRQTLTFAAPIDVNANEQRSHHPVCVFRDGTFDVEDWIYRVLDNYNGPLVARYDLFSENPEFANRIADVVLMSFEQWKQHTTRRDYASFQTFEDLVAFLFPTEIDVDL